MIAFICLFFPAMIPVWIYEALSRTPLAPRQILYRYSFNVVIVNLFCFAVKYILGTAQYAFSPSDTGMLPSTAMKYLLFAVVFAVALGLGEVILGRHVKFTVEEDGDEEEK